MKTVLPSQVVAFIDASIPEARNAKVHEAEFAIDYSRSSTLKTLTDLLEALDDTLLPPDDDYVAFIAAIASIKAILEEWTSRGVTRTLKWVPGYNENPIALIRSILSKCPDTVIPVETEGLEFITDDRYKEELRAELASVAKLLQIWEWKAAMVLASSLMEALLCEVLLNLEQNLLHDAVDRAIADKTVRKNTKPEPLTWNLLTYIQVANAAGLVSDRTRDYALLAGDYRNLIHPGKTRRESAACNKAAGLSVVAGLEHIVADLTRYFERQPNPSLS